MTNETLAQDVLRNLVARKEKIALAESCTAGSIAAALGQIPGISNHFCGSAVAYRADTKRRWLQVKRKTIKNFTTESHETAKEMAIGIMTMCPEATWGVSVVGHFGPDSPEDKDGLMYITIVRRTKKNKLKIYETFEYKLNAKERILRQNEGVCAVLTFIAKTLNKKTQSEEHKIKVA